MCTVVFPLREVAELASASAALALAILLLIRHVMEPRLSEAQRIAFNVAVLPLLSVLAIFIVADFMEALP